MTDNTKKDDAEIIKAKINYRQAVLVAIIAIIPTIFATYWTTKPKGNDNNWESKYSELKNKFDSLRISFPKRHEFSDLSILLMDTHLRNYPSVPKGQTNSHVIKKVIKERNLGLTDRNFEIYAVQQGDSHQIRQLKEIKDKRPDVLIIHGSAFPDNEKAEDEWLISFIQDLLDDESSKQTRILIYSRELGVQCFKSNFSNPEHREMIDINVWCDKKMPFKNKESIESLGDRIVDNLKLALYIMNKKATNNG